MCFFGFGLEWLFWTRKGGGLNWNGDFCAENFYHRKESKRRMQRKSLDPNRRFKNRQRNFRVKAREQEKEPVNVELLIIASGLFVEIQTFPETSCRCRKKIECQTMARDSCLLGSGGKNRSGLVFCFDFLFSVLFNQISSLTEERSFLVFERVDFICDFIDESWCINIIFSG